jgi:hypothetical protein
MRHGRRGEHESCSLLQSLGAEIVRLEDQVNCVIWYICGPRGGAKVYSSHRSGGQRGLDRVEAIMINGMLSRGGEEKSR